MADWSQEPAWLACRRADLPEFLSDVVTLGLPMSLWGRSLRLERAESKKHEHAWRTWKKIKDQDSMRPFKDQLRLCEGQVRQRGGVLVPQLIENPDLNLTGCLQRRNAEVQGQCHWPVCCKDKFCSQPPTRLEKKVSRSLILSFLHHWYFDHYCQPEILWEDFQDTLWILQFHAAIHWLRF